MQNSLVLGVLNSKSDSYANRHHRHAVHGADMDVALCSQDQIMSSLDAALPSVTYRVQACLQYAPWILHIDFAAVFVSKQCIA